MSIHGVDQNRESDSGIFSRDISTSGESQRGNSQVWCNNDDLRRHAIIFGTTGTALAGGPGATANYSGHELLVGRCF